MDQLAENFSEISLSNTTFRGCEFGSASNSTSAPAWVEPRELAPVPSRGSDFPFELRNASAIYVETLTPQHTGKEIVSDYSSNSDAAL